MKLRRQAIFRAVLLATALFALPYGAKPVQAGSEGVSDALVNRVFAASNFPALDGETQAPALPDGKGKELIQQKCTMCHAANLWMSQRHTRDEWGSVLDNMMSKGLEASNEDLDTMATYLAQNFGPVAKTPPATPPAAPASDPPPAKPPFQ